MSIEKRVTIYGLTDSTITLNTLNMVLRGNCNNQKMFPNSVAKHILIINSAQESELNVLKKMNLIKVVEETEIENIPVVQNATEIKNQAEENDNEIIDGPTKFIEKETTKEESKNTDVKLDQNKELAYKLYREGILDHEAIVKVLGYDPDLIVLGADGSVLNKNDIKEDTKTEKKIEKVGKAKKIRKLDINEAKETAEVKAIKKEKKQRLQKKDEEVNMVKYFDEKDNAPVELTGYLDDTESILAGEKFDAEQKEKSIPIDESVLPPEEQMGNDVVISAGKETIKTPMKRTSNDRDPFIDRVEEETEQDKMGNEVTIANGKDTIKVAMKKSILTDPFVDKEDQELREKIDQEKNILIPNDIIDLNEKEIEDGDQTIEC